MNRKPLPVGVDLFEMVITRGYYFVDKTLFIKELLDKKGSVRLFTRPRRFGKTLNLSMVQCFFENKEKALTVFWQGRLQMSLTDTVIFWKMTHWQFIRSVI